MAEPLAELILSVVLCENNAFSSRSLYVEDIYEVLEKVLKIHPDDLSVCQRGPKLAKFWHVGVKTEEIWDRLDLSKHVGEIYRLRLGTEVQICKTLETCEKITVKHIPPHWGKEHVERIFSFYGKIVNMKREPMKYSVRGCKRSYEKVWNGNWRIRMAVKKSIPSNLIISGWQIEVFYRTQTRTCYRCGQDGHVASQCDTRYRDFENRFNMEDYPELVRKEPIVVGDDVNDEGEENEKEKNEENEMPGSSEEANEENDTQRKNEENGTFEEAGIEEVAGAGDKVVSEEQPKDKAPVSINEDYNMEEISGDSMEDTSKRTLKDKKKSKRIEDPVEDTSKKTSKNETVREVLVEEDVNKSISQEEGFKQITITADVMHRDCSQVEKKDPETTETASEGEDMESSRDSGITPAQRINEEIINEEMEFENEDLELQLTPSSQVDPQLVASSSQVGPSGKVQSGVKRDNNDLLSGTDEEAENIVRVDAGSLVNSFFSKARKKLKDTF